jgi:DNA primase
MARLTNEFKGKLHQYFVRKLGAYDYRNGWLKCNCPFCGKEAKFGINLAMNRTNCFRCGEHPSAIQLAIQLENFTTYAELVEYLNKGDFSGYTYVEEAVELKSRKEVYLPEGFKSILLGDSLIAKAARKYVQKRGFDLNEVAMKGWGYVTKGKYMGYLIIPFHENGKLVYFNARLFIGSGPKYNNPETSDTGLGKSFIIYNKDALSMYRMVYLCEGALNAETMGERGIASGGKAVSRYQINEIIKSPVERIIILLDPDAKDKAIELALKLVNYKKVKVVFLPEGTDVNDIGKKKTLKLVYSTPYQDYNKLLTLKHNL